MYLNRKQIRWRFIFNIQSKGRVTDLKYFRELQGVPSPATQNWLGEQCVDHSQAAEGSVRLWYDERGCTDRGCA